MRVKKINERDDRHGFGGNGTRTRGKKKSTGQLQCRNEERQRARKILECCSEGAGCKLPDLRRTTGLENVSEAALDR